MSGETEFILQCNPNSFIEQVMYSKATIQASTLLNQPLLFCLTGNSLEAGKQFLERIRMVGKAENAVLSILIEGVEHRFLFSGVQLRDHLIIVAQHTPQDESAETTQVTDALITDEMNEALQSLDIPAAAEKEAHSEITVWDLLEEMSRVNNELINTKRELMRKNMELERLQKQLKKG